MALFEPIMAALSGAEVRFVVVGGVATVLHGYPRLTADLDLAIDLAPAQALAAVQALLGLGLVPLLPVDARDFADPELRRRWIEERNLVVFTFYDPADPLRQVDLFARNPIPFADLWERAVEVELEEVSVRIASIDDLIFMKRAAGRAQDLDDIGALEEIQRRGPRS